VPPPLYPGATDASNAAWCIPPCRSCGCLHRRYANNDYIEITPLVRKTFIRMLQSMAIPVQVNPARMFAYMEIRLRGCETLIARYETFQRTLDGYLGFYWDATFTGANPGLYVGDVYIDCCYCFSVKFRIPRCSIVVDSYYNEMAVEDCGYGECSMLVTVGEGVVGGLECEVVPPASECGLPAPYFETTDPAVQNPPENCNLSCSPPFMAVGDGIIGDI
jgi:hypothetical protein